MHSYKGEGLHAEVDLGASIITGTVADVKSGARADPCALLAEQLGVPLHSLNADMLPLYDTADGKRITAELDAAVERWASRCCTADC